MKISFPGSILDSSVLIKSGRLSGEDFDIYSWWTRLAEKLNFPGIMDLVVDMVTDVKRAMRPNTFGMPFFLIVFILNCSSSP